MLNKLPRMFDWLLVTLVLICFIAVLSPQQLPVSLYKLSLITMAAVVAFWLDCRMFPYARPDSYLAVADWRKCQKQEQAADAPVVPGYELIFAVAMLRRAIIVGLAMVAAALGM